MKQLFVLLFILNTGILQANTNLGTEKPDSVTSLEKVKESYKLSGETLAALAEKIRYKKTPQEDMYLYLLRPMTKT